MRPSGIASDILVDKIKQMQRNDECAKVQWWTYCDQHGDRVRDPSKHDDHFLTNFITQYEAGARMDMTEAPTGMATLLDLVKEGQRKSAIWKEAWSQYCMIHGGGMNDPKKHDQSFLIAFLDYVGQAGMMAMTMSMPMAGPGGKRPRMMAPMVGLGGGGEVGGFDSGTDFVKNQLVMRVKNYQRSNEDNKETWWSHCDANLGGIRDPNRHDAKVLQQFLSIHGVP